MLLIILGCDDGGWMGQQQNLIIEGEAYFSLANARDVVIYIEWTT